MENLQTEISIQEAARRLGTTLSYAYALVYAAKLSARKQDGKWLVSASAVESRRLRKIGGQ